MAGFGKFKLSDALPKDTAGTGGDSASAGPPVKGMPKAKARGKKGTSGGAGGSRSEPTEQVRQQSGRQQKGK